MITINSNSFYIKDKTSYEFIYPNKDKAIEKAKEIISTKNKNIETLTYPLDMVISIDAFSKIDKTWKNIGNLNNVYDLINNYTDKEVNTITDDYATYEIEYEPTKNLILKITIIIEGTHNNGVWKKQSIVEVYPQMFIYDVDETTYLYRDIAKKSGQHDRRKARIAINNIAKNEMFKFLINIPPTELSTQKVLYLPYIKAYYNREKNNYYTYLYNKVTVFTKEFSKGYWKVINKNKIFLAVEKISDLY